MSQTLMIQGTSSDAGKTTLVAALGRILRRQGLRVVPFKPQNMALNSAVTVDGGEIGRGQAVQAQACGLEPHSDMNPILLKPCTDTGAQVIIHGRALSNMEAAAYQDYKKHAMTAVLQSYGRLQAQYDFIVVEGAGSPAEVNLREGDVANMGFAEAVNCPVILVADIDRGGVFAQLVGTLALLSASEQQRVIGFVINRFRGDLELLKPGLTWLEQRTGKPVLGVIPYIDKLHVEAEDALTGNAGASHSQCIRVKVPVWPRISNHTDFDPLRLHPQVAFEFVGPGGSLAGADLIVLPGSKSSRADLQFLRRQGWQAQIRQHLRYGGKVIGICGGLQMLGQAIHDPDGIEGEPGSEAGLGLLDFETTLQPEKCLRNVRGQLQLPGQAPVSVTGYEIHAGQSNGPALARPVIRADGRGDGCISEDGQLLASYWHGLFDSEPALQALLSWAGLSEVVPLQYRAQVEAELDRLADTVAAHLDGARLMQRVGDFEAKT